VPASGPHGGPCEAAEYIKDPPLRYRNIARADGLAMFHVWTRHMVTELGYSLSESQAITEQLLSENKALKLEISTLKSSKRLELIAKGQLGLTPPKPEQVVYLWLDE